VDGDHIGGLTWLAQSGIEVGAWYASDFYFEYQEKKHPLSKLGVEVTWLHAGDILPAGDGTTLTVLAPLTKNEDDEDENSLVLMLNSPDGRVLLAGDMESSEEAELLASLNHPHICTIYDIGTHVGQHYIVMELLEGQTLRELVLERRLTVSELLALALQVADALETAHAKGIVHRDIKPANLFVTRRGDAKVLDFGLAKLVAGAAAADESLTRIPPVQLPKALLTDPGTAVGTLAYMSPEQALGKEVDARTDLFSLGVVLYEIATGRLPFRGDTSVALIDSLLKNELSAFLAKKKAESKGLLTEIFVMDNKGLNVGQSDVTSDYGWPG
jgi:serine/threonine protein kinase